MPSHDRARLPLYVEDVAAFIFSVHKDIHTLGINQKAFYEQKEHTVLVNLCTTPEGVTVYSRDDCRGNAAQGKMFFEQHSPNFVISDIHTLRLK